MLTKVHRILTTFLLTTSLIWALGCGSSNSVNPDTEPPAIPRGVISITGDERVTIEWFPNGERDLAGYRIWRGSDNDEFDLLKEVSADVSRYVDNDVANGVTYFYAVSAFDLDNNESELSPENVPDTPRPAGNNITLDDFALAPERSGFDFSQPERGAIPWDSSRTDVYFGFDTVVNVPYLYADNSDMLMQDMGYHDSFDELDVSPDKGFTIEFVEMIEGHIYTFWTPNGNFAKIHVVAVSDNAVTFDWAYQTDPDNPQLAPPIPIVD